MKKAIIALTLAGCTNGYLVNTEAPLEIESNVYKKFIGIPLLLGMEGSYVRLSDDWILTAKHNWPLFPLSEWVSHDKCDVALVKMKGEGGLNVGLVYPGDAVLHSGYPIGGGFTSTTGNYIGDVFVVSYPECQMSATTGVIQQGMSGGAVSKDNQLIGIIHGYAHGDVSWSNGTKHYKPTIFISINHIKDWIEEVTGETLYNE